MTENSLPDYQPRLDAFHAAFHAELRAIVRSLPMSATMQVLDVGCGDGFYDRLLAERLQSPGSVTGLDTNPAYIDLASQTVAGGDYGCEVHFIQGRLDELASHAGRWDLIWCAQSLYSLPEPVQALSLMGRLVRAGGLVVILENDTLHELLMPWPPELEMALRIAELRKLAAETQQAGKFYVGRRLPAVFAEAGLEPLHFRTQCIDRQGPLEPAVRNYLELYLADLLAGTRDHLDAAVAERLERLIDPESPHYLPRQPHFTMSWINALAWGRRPC